MPRSSTLAMPNAASSRLLPGPYSEATVKEAARAALEEAGGAVTLGFAFASADYGERLEDFLELVQLHGHVPLLAGCSGSGVIGVGREVEQASGFSLLFLSLPEAELHTAILTERDVEEAASPEDWHRITGVGVGPGEVNAWISLVDPFGFPVEPWLESWNAAYPGVPTLGGLCSSGAGGTESAQADTVFVARNRERLDPGSALLIGLGGGVRVSPVLSQGCRPIGEPLTVTGTDGNLVLALGGKPAYAALAEAFESLSEEDKTRAQGNLFAGFASSEYVEEFKRGDFLIRTILGADSGSGAVALGAYPRVGQTLQWQLRDRRSADTDLLQRLGVGTGPGTGRGRQRPFASLVFSCNGRGRELFGSPDHDARALAKAVGPIPSAGLFCNGEIAPVSGRSFVHGYSVSIALFM